MGTIDYEALAIEYKNAALINKSVASIFLENKNDEAFWNAQIQSCKSGEYNFVYATRDGSSGSGCHSCDKFKGFLSKDFFVCYDSDWKLLLGKAGHPTKENFYAQTYAYSWENHCCYADTLQTRFISAFPAMSESFDFSTFLLNLSHNIYKYFLQALWSASSTNISPLFDFYNQIPMQVKKEEILDNGNLLIENIVNNLEKSCLDPSFDYTFAKSKFGRMGLTEDNCYLYIKGHIIYNLIVYIGKMLTKDKQKFISDVLKPQLAGNYNEAVKMHDDLKYILNIP